MDRLSGNFQSEAERNQHEEACSDLTDDIDGCYSKLETACNHQGEFYLPDVRAMLRDEVDFVADMDQPVPTKDVFNKMLREWRNRRQKEPGESSMDLSQ